MVGGLLFGGAVVGIGMLVASTAFLAGTACLCGLAVAALTSAAPSGRAAVPVPRPFAHRGDRYTPPLGGRVAPAHRDPVPPRARAADSEERWIKGARGEIASGRALEALGAPVLHDRAVPRSRANIDHLVVTDDTIFVVDTKNYSGRMHVSPATLTVSGRDETALLVAVRRQSEVVRAALIGAGVSSNVVPVLCFTGTARPSHPWQVRGVTVTATDQLADVVAAPSGQRAVGVADLLAWGLPPVTQ